MGSLFSPSDVQNYGTGVLRKFPVGYDMTPRECASYPIKESYNTAWVMLERYLGRGSMEDALRAVGAKNADYGNLRTTPEDVLLMPRAVEDCGFTNPKLSGEMLDLMTNTALEDRLPHLLPEGTRPAQRQAATGTPFRRRSRSLRRPAKEERAPSHSRDVQEHHRRGGAIRKTSLAAYQALHKLGKAPVSAKMPRTLKS